MLTKSGERFISRVNGTSFHRPKEQQSRIMIISVCRNIEVCCRSAFLWKMQYGKSRQMGFKILNNFCSLKSCTTFNLQLSVSPIFSPQPVPIICRGAGKWPFLLYHSRNLIAKEDSRMHSSLSTMLLRATSVEQLLICSELRLLYSFTRKQAFIVARLSSTDLTNFGRHAPTISGRNINACFKCEALEE